MVMKALSGKGVGASGGYAEFNHSTAFTQGETYSETVDFEIKHIIAIVGNTGTYKFMIMIYDVDNPTIRRLFWSRSGDWNNTGSDGADFFSVNGKTFTYTAAGSQYLFPTYFIVVG